MMPIPATLERACDPRGLGGLIATVGRNEVAFPLRSVKVRTAIAGDCARTTIEQRFANTFATVVDVVHIFPLPDEGAVIAVELRTGDRIVRAECRERADAEQVFDDARRAGHVAGLLTAERDDVHTLRVANLAPGHEVTVTIVVVERLEVVDGQTRWRFPTAVAPRYTPGAAIGHLGAGAVPDTDRVPDASRLAPPLRLIGGTTLDIEVEVAGPVRAIASSMHAVSVDFDDGAVRIAPAGDASCDRDFVLAFRTREDGAVAVRAWTDGTYTLVRVEPPFVPVDAMARDAVFVVDISGSMGGVKMNAAKRALKAAMHGLSAGDRFALIAFDDRIERMGMGLMAYDDHALRQADAWVDALFPRGGTEMLPAIVAAFDGKTPADRLRTVLFITDGQATNDAELIAAVANRRGAARFFTLGIDTAVNAALMRSLARAGGGVAELCTPEDDIEATVARIEARFGTPLADNVVIAGGIASRPEPSALFAGRPVSMLVEGGVAEVVVTATMPGGSFHAAAVPRRIAFPLGALWARERVSYLDGRLAMRPFEEEAIRPEVLRIALAHQIASKYTAFVAVDRSTTVHGPKVEVVQPVQLPQGWDAKFATGSPAPVRSARPVPGSAPVMARGPLPPPSPSAPSTKTAFWSRDDMKKALEEDDAAAPGPAAGGGSATNFWTGEQRKAMEEGRADAPRPKRKGEKVAKADVADEDLGGPPIDFRSAKSGSRFPADEALTPKVPPPSAARAAAELALLQGADGSFGSDVRRTAAALVALALLGHTRVGGARQRVAAKAFAWLAKRGEPEAKLAIALTTAIELGQKPAIDANVRALASAGREGQLLETVL